MQVSSDSFDKALICVVNKLVVYGPRMHGELKLWFSIAIDSLVTFLDNSLYRFRHKSLGYWIDQYEVRVRIIEVLV